MLRYLALLAEILHAYMQINKWRKSRSTLNKLQDFNERRHLLRMWIAPLNERPLPENFNDHYASTEIGKRGGIIVPIGKGSYNRVPLDPE